MDYEGTLWQGIVLDSEYLEDSESSDEEFDIPLARLSDKYAGITLLFLFPNLISFSQYESLEENIYNNELVHEKMNIFTIMNMYIQKNGIRMFAL